MPCDARESLVMKTHPHPLATHPQGIVYSNHQRKPLPVIKDPPELEDSPILEDPFPGHSSLEIRVPLRYFEEIGV